MASTINFYCNKEEPITLQLQNLGVVNIETIEWYFPNAVGLMHKLGNNMISLQVIDGLIKLIDGVDTYKVRING